MFTLLSALRAKRHSINVSATDAPELKDGKTDSRDK